MPTIYHYNSNQKSRNVLLELWDSFWYPPDVPCPKCGAVDVEYYDPFFFSPIRLLRNRRRIQCRQCHFIWRPNRKTKTIWERL